MPELPDINAYLCALEARIVGQTLERVRLWNAFVLRTAQPPDQPMFKDMPYANLGESASVSPLDSTMICGWSST